MKKYDLITDIADKGKRVDIYASEALRLTRSQIQRLIEKKYLKANGLDIKPNYRVKQGDIVSIIVPDDDIGLIPQDLPVDILFMDEFVMVVNKPPDMVVYPAAGHYRGTVMNAVSYHSKKLASVGSPLRPGVVHRLDKDTSGIMVIALDDNSYYNLVEQFRARSINRKYIALVYGLLKTETGRIALKIGRSEADRKKMSTRARRGKEAATKWRVLERLGRATLIEASLETGRTHQIRVHFASVGHPVLGDKTYVRQTFLEITRTKIIFPRQMLHAGLLGFSHPATGQYMEFVSELPQDMTSKIDELRNLTSAEKS